MAHKIKGEWIMNKRILVLAILALVLAACQPAPVVTGPDGGNVPIAVPSPATSKPLPMPTRDGASTWNGHEATVIASCEDTIDGQGPCVMLDEGTLYVVAAGQRYTGTDPDRVISGCTGVDHQPRPCAMFDDSGTGWLFQ